MNAPRNEADTDFREQCRRQLDRPLAARIRHGFSRVHKPVLDDAPTLSARRDINHF